MPLIYCQDLVGLSCTRRLRAVPLSPCVATIATLRRHTRTSGCAIEGVMVRSRYLNHEPDAPLHNIHLGALGKENLCEMDMLHRCWGLCGHLMHYWPVTTTSPPQDPIHTNRTDHYKRHHRKNQVTPTGSVLNIQVLVPFYYLVALICDPLSNFRFPR